MPVPVAAYRCPTSDFWLSAQQMSASLKDENGRKQIQGVSIYVPQYGEIRLSQRIEISGRLAPIC